VNISAVKHRLNVLAIVLAMTLAGCGGTGDRPPLGAVYGTVTFEGKPLYPCKVTMYSLEKGRPSSGYTNEEGEYEMRYLFNVDGVKAGKCKVFITTALGDDEPGGPHNQILPKPYWQKETVLSANIIADQSNVINFALSASGAPPAD